MRGRPWLWGALALVLTLIAALVLAGGGGAGRPSALSGGPLGWLAARHYLEARGTEVRLLDRPATDGLPEVGPGAGLEVDALPPVVVTGFPWRDPGPAVERLALATWVRRGGTLVVAYGGREGPGWEGPLLEDLDLAPEEVRGEPPLGYLGWRRHQDEQWTLVPAPELASGARPVTLRALDRVPVSPEAARVLYRRQTDGFPLAFSVERGAGRIVVVPAEALANARLAAGGGDLVESLADWLGGLWSFDEYHHGLRSPDTAAAVVPRWVIDLFAAHLGLLYLLAVAALARRFGPAWRDPPVRSGSAASFLRGLGALHHRLGHHPEAARRLLARARELNPHLTVTDALAARAASADAIALVSLARHVARQTRRT